MTGPYETAARDWWAAGWRGVLPLPAGRKAPPPNAFTGATGEWPRPEDRETWIAFDGDGNIGLRLPEDVLGVDVDQYGTKRGGDQFAHLEAELGTLPPTIVSTSRLDGVSGIRLFLAPPGPWPGQVAGHIEAIHYGHRYAVVWPSLHPEGRRYVCVDQRTGEILDRVPTREDLARLPESWVTHLRSRATEPTAKANVKDDRVRGWLEALRKGRGCDRVTLKLAEALERLGEESRHEVMLGTSMALVSYGARGHAGAYEALQELYGAFLKAAQDADKGTARRQPEAVAEWRRALRGAVGALVHKGYAEPSTLCHCLPELVSIGATAEVAR